MSASDSPITPTRPARSIHRQPVDAYTTPTSTSVQSPDTPDTPPDDVLATPHAREDSESDSDVEISVTPQTPGSPVESRLTRSKSLANSIKRKPVPAALGATDAAGASSEDPSSHQAPHIIHTHPGSTSLSPGAPLAPPVYTLPVDPPLGLTSTPAPPSDQPYTISSYPPPPPFTLAPTHAQGNVPHSSGLEGLRDMGVSAGVSPPSFRSSEDLPLYSEDKKTESNTLAKELWKWGWLCPLLWGIGMTILWSPLITGEADEEDPTKAQRLKEMGVIIRESLPQTELKYAKRCLWCFVGFCTLIALIIVLVVVLKQCL